MFLPRKSRKENPQKLTQLSPIWTAKKGTIKDITSDSLVNSNFSYRWSPASLTINIQFYLFPYLIYITRKTKKQHTTSKIKEPKPKSRLGTACNKTTGVGGGGGFNKFAVDQSSPFVLPWILRHLVFGLLGLLGRILANKCIILETQKSKLKLRYRNKNSEIPEQKKPAS